MEHQRLLAKCVHHDGIERVAEMVVSDRFSVRVWFSHTSYSPWHERINGVEVEWVQLRPISFSAAAVWPENPGAWNSDT